MQAVRQSALGTGIVSRRDGGIDYEVARSSKRALLGSHAWRCYADGTPRLQSDNTRTYGLSLRDSRLLTVQREGISSEDLHVRPARSTQTPTPRLE